MLKAMEIILRKVNKFMHYTEVHWRVDNNLIPIKIEIIHLNSHLAKDK